MYRRKHVRLALALVVTLSMTLGAIGPASAQSPEPLVKHIVAPMVVIDPVTRAPVQGVTPNGVSYGDCGWSSLYIVNMGGGYAKFLEAAHSTKGFIIHVSYNVYWDNITKGIDDVVVGSDSQLPSSDWYNEDNRWTWTGDVVATMSGTVDLVGGLTCAILYPSDYTTIT